MWCIWIQYVTKSEIYAKVDEPEAYEYWTLVHVLEFLDHMEQLGFTQGAISRLCHSIRKFCSTATTRLTLSGLSLELAKNELEQIVVHCKRVCQALKQRLNLHGHCINGREDMVAAMGYVPNATDIRNMCTKLRETGLAIMRHVAQTVYEYECEDDEMIALEFHQALMRGTP